MTRTRVATGRASVAVVTATTAAAAPVEGGWPRAYTTPSGDRVRVYQPQVASWDEKRHMVAYAAVGFEAKGATKPAPGSLKIEADTRVAVSERLVNFSVLQVTESNFPTLKKEEVRELVAEIVRAIPDEERVIALDRVLACVGKSQILPKNAEGVKADPPRIFFSQTPAVLANLDGEPIWSPIRENDLKFAVNTNWDLFEHGSTKTFYLRNEKAWLKATDLAGPWSPAGTLPESFGKLPADENWKEVKAALPGQKLAADKAPKVFVSTTLAEMILVDGKPLYKPVSGTKLAWVSNTESDVFRVGGTGPVFSLAFVMAQFSATAYSPRLVAWFAGSAMMSHSLGVFTAPFDEIRYCGANSIQVMWRMRALLQDLSEQVPLERRAALQSYLERVDNGIRRTFEDGDDRKGALEEDRQGLGLSRERHQA